MAWTTPTTVNPGDAILASLWNTQVRDNLQIINALGSAWTTWTPVLRTGGVAVTLGTGSESTGRYIRLGTVVIGEFYIKFGTSGVSVGAGSMDLSALPIAATGQSEGNVVIGSCWATDATGSMYIGVFSAARNFYADGAGNTVWGQTVPFTWAANDAIRCSFTYQCAPAA